MFLDEIQDWLALVHNAGISQSAFFEIIWDSGMTYKMLWKATAEKADEAWAEWKAIMRAHWVARQIVVMDESSKDDCNIFCYSLGNVLWYLLTLCEVIITALMYSERLLNLKVCCTIVDMTNILNLLPEFLLVFLPPTWFQSNWGKLQLLCVQFLLSELFFFPECTWSSEGLYPL
jgi:hypothetical protein